MLKLTYTETSFCLERLSQSLEEWIADRVVLAVRSGENICVEPSTAAFLLPADLADLYLLAAQVKQAGIANFSLCLCDLDYVEVSLQGSWLRETADSIDGIFVATMSDATESLLVKLWQESQICTSLMNR